MDLPDPPTGLPPGVRLLRSLEGHKEPVTSVAFDPAGATLASGGADHTVKFWEVESGQLLRSLDNRGAVASVAFDSTGTTLASAGEDRTIKLREAKSGRLLRSLTGDPRAIFSIAFDPAGAILASGGADGNVKLWKAKSGQLLRSLDGHKDSVLSVAFDPAGAILASSGDKTVKLWEAKSGKPLCSLEGTEDAVDSVAFDPTGATLASGGFDDTVKLWEAKSGKLLRLLEGHTGIVVAVAWSRGGNLLASQSWDGTVRLWRCDSWEPVAVIPGVVSNRYLPYSALAFHPTEPLLATGGSPAGAAEDDRGKLIRLWQLDLDTLLGKVPGRAAKPARAVHHTTARIVLVGDSGVGKTGLGWRLTHGKFKKHASTHGQQFWVCNDLGTRRADRTECEAVLWDLAGQPDYRLIHALFLDEADLALVLFDPTDAADPLHGVEFWLRQLKVGQTFSVPVENDGRLKVCPTLLVAARCDRGDARLTDDELTAFCRARGIAGYIRTSARTGEGLDDLLARMKQLVAWDQKPATVTTTTFKRIKDYVLAWKESAEDRPVLVSAEELRRRLEATDPQWRFTNDEMRTAVGHLENYGYVKRLRTSRGERRVLLAPELLNNLAASFVLEARRNARGLGALEEKRLLEGGYDFPELAGLPAEVRTILLDAATLLFLEHHICFRESDPLNGQSFLIFPELINLKRPLDEEKPVEEATAYTVSGAVENVFASLVVLFGYTQTFTRTQQWQDNARYEVSDGAVCGFRQETARDGELSLTLCFSNGARRPVRTLFQGLFEGFLARRNLTVLPYEPVVCVKCGRTLARAVVRQRLKEVWTFAFCSHCGKRLALAKEEPIQLNRVQQAEVETTQKRTRFEKAIFSLKAYVTEQKIKVPECFISYAWGVPKHERWVEKSLATDLQNAGIAVVLDRWESAKIGTRVSRFVARIGEADHVIVVGTPLYREKYESRAPMGAAFVVGAEGDLIGDRIIRQRSVPPVLLAGTEESSFPNLLHGCVYADFRRVEDYFLVAFNLILSIYDLRPNHPAVADLVESLRSRFERV
jgi:GTPase SAR1 family protein